MLPWEEERTTGGSVNATRAPNDRQALLRSLYAEMRPHRLYPPCEVLASLVTSTPRSTARARRWSYDPAREYLLRAGALISVDKAARRVLILRIPACPAVPQ